MVWLGYVKPYKVNTSFCIRFGHGSNPIFRFGRQFTFTDGTWSYPEIVTPSEREFAVRSKSPSAMISRNVHIHGIIEWSSKCLRELVTSPKITGEHVYYRASCIGHGMAVMGWFHCVLQYNQWRRILCLGSPIFSKARPGPLVYLRLFSPRYTFFSCFLTGSGVIYCKFDPSYYCSNRTTSNVHINF